MIARCDRLKELLAGCSKLASIRSASSTSARQASPVPATRRTAPSARRPLALAVAAGNSVLECEQGMRGQAPRPQPASELIPQSRSRHRSAATSRHIAVAARASATRAVAAGSRSSPAGPVHGGASRCGCFCQRRRAVASFRGCLCKPVGALHGAASPRAAAQCPAPETVCLEVNSRFAFAHRAS